jgi:short subunit fatty acids transporter
MQSATPIASIPEHAAGSQPSVPANSPIFSPYRLTICIMTIILKLCMMINMQISSVGDARDGSDAAAALRRIIGSRKASSRGFGRALAAH